MLQAQEFYLWALLDRCKVVNTGQGHPFEFVPICFSPFWIEAICALTTMTRIAQRSAVTIFGRIASFLCHPKDFPTLKKAPHIRSRSIYILSLHRLRRSSLTHRLAAILRLGFHVPVVQLLTGSVRPFVSCKHPIQGIWGELQWSQDLILISTKYIYIYLDLDLSM